MRTSTALVICLPFVHILLTVYVAVEMVLEGMHPEENPVLREYRDSLPSFGRRDHHVINKNTGISHEVSDDAVTKIVRNPQSDKTLQRDESVKFVLRQRLTSNGNIKTIANAANSAQIMKLEKHTDSKDLKMHSFDDKDDSVVGGHARDDVSQPSKDNSVTKDIGGNRISTKAYVHMRGPKSSASVKYGNEIDVKDIAEDNVVENDYDIYPAFVDTVNSSGPGEHGLAVELNVSQLSAEDKTRYDEGWRRNAFNQYVSDMISVRRSLPEAWTQECKDMRFRSDLPQVSVVITFHNEAWSALLRTVHSVLSRTPAYLLQEVILVDDFSTYDYLKKPLNQYWKWEPRVKVVRALKREGLTRARLLGYNIAKAPVLVFFDSHIECFPGWYEPLADRIASNPNITVFPAIELIDEVTLRVLARPAVQSRGVFKWSNLMFDWDGLPEKQRVARKSSAEPIKSPTMPGGLFAISRDFFTILGTYDPALDYWGGENIELSFKAWMCHGAVEMAPCSHVGHIFRGRNPISWESNVGYKNSVRVAEVWMDDFKNYFFEMILYNVGNYGDVSERRRLRERLGCRTFEWFMKNVAFMALPPEHVLTVGEIKNMETGQCIDSMGNTGKRPRLMNCHGQGGNQGWYITQSGQFLQEKHFVCLVNDVLILRKTCTDKWQLSRHGLIVHTPSSLCLDKDRDSLLTLKQCDRGNARQKWTTTPRRSDLRFPSLT